MNQSKADRIVALCERYTEAQITADQLIANINLVIESRKGLPLHAYCGAEAITKDDITEAVMEDGGL